MSIKPTTCTLAAAALLQSATLQASTVIEEVVITATKRAESLQDVGVAVTAFGSEQLKELGTVQAVELAAQTPNLVTKNAVGNTAPIFSIRGISLNDFATNGTQPVGVYVDEVYLSNNSQLSFQLLDTERVEVLKGPQGTLYGRNTTAGAVNFISNKPKEDFEADISFTAGNYDYLGLEGVINGTLSEGLYGRFAAKVEDQSDGFFRNDITNQNHGEVERFGWRGQLLWETDDDVSVLFNIHGGRDRSDNWINSLLSVVALPMDDLSETARDNLLAADIDDNDIHRGGFNGSPEIDNTSVGGAVTINWDINEITLISITSYDQLDYFRTEDFDGTALVASNNDYNGFLEQYSQEFRLLGTAFDNWDWIVGVFYGKDELEEHDIFRIANNPVFLIDLSEDYDQETTSFAIYTHNEIQLSDALKLTVGLRYTDEEREFDGGTTDTDTGGTIINAVVNNDVDFQEVTGRLGLDFQANDDLLLYASYSRGYKAGGFTGFVVFVPEEKDPYDPEFVDAYEIGFKSTLLEGSLQLNGAAFYYDYEDLQRTGLNPDVGTIRIFNIDESEVIGAELDLWWRPTDGLDIKFGVGYLDTEVKASDLFPEIVGNDLANSTPWQLNTMIGYEWSVSDNLNAKVVVDASWQDDVNFGSTADPQQEQEAYTLGNARIIVSSADDDWSVELWGKNLGDVTYFGEIFNDTGITSGIPGARHTYGITFNKSWR